MILLVCNWLHYVGKNHFDVMMLLYRGSVIFKSLLIQSYGSKRFCSDSNSEKLDPLHSFGRRDIPSGHSTVQASSIRTTRTFRQDLPLCREPSNCSSLHPFGLFSNTSECLLAFDRLKDFFPKHRYGKTTATVRTMCVLIWTLSLIRQVLHSMFNHSDVSLQGPDAQASYMEIACNNSTVRMRKALIWKMRVGKVQPSERYGNTVRMRLNSENNFSKFEKPIARLFVLRP